MESEPGDVRDHGGVVGAELEGREHDPDRGGNPPIRKLTPEPFVRAHAAAHHEYPVTGLHQCTETFFNKHLDHGRFERAGEIRTVGGGRLGQRFERIEERCLETAEAHLRTGLIKHGAREPVAFRPPTPGEPRERRPSRIGQPEQNGSLVKCFPGRIITRCTEQPVTPEPQNLDELGMPTRDDERDEGRFEALGSQASREDMRLKVMNAQKWNVPCEGQAPTQGMGNVKRAGQTRTRSGGNRRKVSEPYSRLEEKPFDERQKVPRVIA